MIDLLVESSPVNKLDLQGASRTVGGIFRGRAHGNVLNQADFDNMEDDNPIPIPGKVHLYVTPSSNPADWNILSMSCQLVKMPVNNSLAPILRVIGDKHSPPCR